MKYSKHSMNQKRKTSFRTDWEHKEGVFLSPNGKYIARVRDKSTLKTLSQHESKEEAEVVYNNFNKTKKK